MALQDFTIILELTWGVLWREVHTKSIVLALFSIPKNAKRCDR
jgi:hypothetical protein